MLRIPINNAKREHLLFERQPPGAAFLPSRAAVSRLAADDVALSAKRADIACFRLDGGCFLLLFGGGRALLGLLGGLFFVDYGNSAVGGVSHYLVNDFRHLRFQLLDKLLCIVFAMLNVAQFLLPNACQFAAFQQFLADKTYPSTPFYIISLCLSLI